MKTIMYDVIIIGAGVAGSSAAFHLANAGLKVSVLEKAKIPRYKTCGGGVIKRAAELLPFSIDSVIERSLVRADIFDQDNNLHFKAEKNYPAILMVMRADFDDLILSKAAEKGAVVMDSSEVIALDNFADSVQIKTKKETFRSKFIIAADGATGISAKSLGVKNETVNVAALEVEATVDQSIFDMYKDSARFDYGLIPFGYAWVFPKKKHLSIGAAFMKKTSQSLHKWLDKYFEILGIREKDILVKEKHGYLIPLVSNRSTCCSGRVLFAGDALGLADPITAEGISYAIESGQLAAASLIESSYEPSSVRQMYNEKLNALYKELNGAKFLSHFVFGPNWIRKFVFKHYGQRLSELMIDIISNEKTYSGLVRNPFSYIKLLRPEYFIKRRA
jgi:geranylgeranyl reductase family protein